MRKTTKLIDALFVVTLNINNTSASILDAVIKHKYKQNHKCIDDYRFIILNIVFVHYTRQH